MAQSPEPTSADIARHIYAFLMSRLEEDAIRLRPDKPRVRGPLTPLAEKILRILLFHFANVLTGLCNPSITAIAGVTGCADSSVKRLLPALFRAEYLQWRPGKRKRILTRAGYRIVRSSNHYQPLCPRRHLAALRRWLMHIYRGRHSPLIQTMVSRFTPPTEKEKAATEIIAALASDLRPGPARTAHTADKAEDANPPSQAPPEATGSVEIGGVKVADSKLGSVLSGLWAAMEKREQGEQGAGAES